MKDYQDGKPFLSHSLKSLDENMTWNKSRKLELEKRIIRSIDRHIKYSYFRKGFQIVIPSAAFIALLITGIYLFPNMLSNQENVASYENKSEVDSKESNYEKIGLNPNMNTTTKELLEKYKEQIHVPLDLHKQLPNLAKKEHPYIRVDEGSNGFGVIANYQIKSGTLYIEQSTKSPEEVTFDVEKICNDLKEVNGNNRVTLTEINGLSTILVNHDEEGNRSHSMVKVVTDNNVYSVYGSPTIDVLLDITKQVIIKDLEKK